MRTHNIWKTLKLKKKKTSQVNEKSLSNQDFRVLFPFFSPLLISKTDFENEESTYFSLKAESHKNRKKQIVLASAWLQKHAFPLRPILENVLIFLRLRLNSYEQ